MNEVFPVRVPWLPRDKYSALIKLTVDGSHYPVPNSSDFEYRIPFSKLDEAEKIIGCQILRPSDSLPTTPRFNGEVYNRLFDDKRLTGQLRRIFDLMADNKWRTLEEIKQVTGDPPASISAQLRHLRKERFGEHTVNKRSRGDRKKGLYEYQLIVSTQIARGTQGECEPCAA